MDARGFVNDVRARFTTADLDVLAQISLRNKFVLIDSIVGWGWDVRRLTSQLDRSWGEPDPKIWGAHDVAGALHGRDRVERLIQGAGDRLSDDLLAAVRTVVDDFDLEYRAITEVDADGLVTRLGVVERFRAGWWWHRIPVRGPAREEFDGYGLSPMFYIARLELPFRVAELAEWEAVGDGAADDASARFLPLLAEWGSRVRTLELRMDEESEVAAWRGGPVSDWWAQALSTRDRIEALWPRVPPHLLDRARTLVDRIDRRYRDSTREDGDPIPGRDGWWWRREPNGGFARFAAGRVAP